MSPKKVYWWWHRYMGVLGTLTRALKQKKKKRKVSTRLVASRAPLPFPQTLMDLTCSARDSPSVQSGIDLLDDLLLYEILCGRIDVLWWAAVARTCRRWFDVLSCAPAERWQRAFIGTAYDLCDDALMRASERNCAVAWAIRTRALALRSTVRFLPLGHLMCVAVTGRYPAFVEWLRVEQGPPTPCRVRREPHRIKGCRCAHLDTYDPLGNYCPNCPDLGKHASFLWPIACAIHHHNADSMLDDLGARRHVYEHHRLLAASPEHVAALRSEKRLTRTTIKIYLGNDKVVDLLLESARLRLIRRLLSKRLLSGGRALWVAAARAVRIDVLDWLQAHRPLSRGWGSDPKHDPRAEAWWQCSCKRCEIAAAAVHTPGTAALEWVERMEAGIACQHHVYWMALKSGNVAALDWITRRYDSFVRVWDKDMYHDIVGCASLAPSLASIRWLHERGVPIPPTLLRGAAQPLADITTMAYAVDHCHCVPPDKGTMRRMLYECCPLTSWVEMHARRWIRSEWVDSLWETAAATRNTDVARFLASRVATDLYLSPPSSVLEEGSLTRGHMARRWFASAGRSNLQTTVEGDFWRCRVSGVATYWRGAADPIDPYAILWCLANDRAIDDMEHVCATHQQVMAVCALLIAHPINVRGHPHILETLHSTARPWDDRQALVDAVLQAYLSTYQLARDICATSPLLQRLLCGPPRDKTEKRLHRDWHKYHVHVYIGDWKEKLAKGTRLLFPSPTSPIDSL